uniref:Uncharacterized protein n=1 Tax=Rhizophora mucronata TaxID=61149 RepID=A0A2P2IIU2_RHIMU
MGTFCFKPALVNSKIHLKTVQLEFSLAKNCQGWFQDVQTFTQIFFKISLCIFCLYH